MRKYIKPLLFSVSVTVLGCNPNMVDEPTLGVTEENYFNNAVTFRTATVSTYAALYDYYHYQSPSFASSNRGNNWPTATWLLPGDDLTASESFRSEVELFDGGLNPTNDQLMFVFGSSYKMIARANVVIDKVRTIDYSLFNNAEEIGQMEGEALFLRAYAYWKLYNVFGSVPVIEERFSPEDDTNIPKRPAAEVLDLVIEEARMAIDILPESWPGEYAGRATKNSARGLLAKALVFRANYTGNTSDYSEAVSVFNSITATLVPDFINNFDARTENNEESLFEVQAGQATAGFNNTALYNDGPWRGVENLSIYRGYMMQASDPGQININASVRFLITEKLLENFGDDPRIRVFLNPDDGFGGRIFQKYNLPAGTNVITRLQGGSANNERVLRYADLKLIAAEAELKSGNPSAAISHINDVRTRAREWGATSGYGDGTMPENYSTGETNTGTIMQWIMNERFIELAGEGKRFWDLKRWHASGDMDLSGWGGGVEHFSTALASPVQFDVNKHLLFPIPQAEVERNSAITENNPGY